MSPRILLALGIVISAGGEYHSEGAASVCTGACGCRVPLRQAPDVPALQLAEERAISGTFSRAAAGVFTSCPATLLFPNPESPWQRRRNPASAGLSAPCSSPPRPSTTWTVRHSRWPSHSCTCHSWPGSRRLLL